MVDNAEKSKLLAIDGIQLSACSAKINKKKSRLDLALVKCIPGSNTSAVFTRNAFCAAPVIISKNHLQLDKPELFLINSGNANAGNGQQGIHDALTVCKCLADYSNIPIERIIPFSTGVIGENLPVKDICQAIPDLYKTLAENKWAEVSQAILTTDTVEKGISKQITVAGKTVTLTGIAKGSGMIKPDMATMLAFIFTDASIEKNTLDGFLCDVVNKTFNCISIDGDTSTNDACLLVATGAAGNTIIDSTSDDKQKFYNALLEVCMYLAHAIVKDGEGASKFVNIVVENGNDEIECRQVAEAIAHSPLVKTALFASDPNWGRILAAIGRAGIPNLDINNIQLYIDSICVVKNGGRADTYTESDGRKIFEKDKILIQVNLNRGLARFEYWTCDLSYDYVRINAEYRT